MAPLIADRKDIDFVLFDQFEVDELSKHERFADFGKNVVDMIITEARKLALGEILPTLKIGDRIGCQYDCGRVTVPKEFKRAWEGLRDGQWFALSANPEWGGQGLPETVAMAARDYFIGANMALWLFAGGTSGAARLIELFGNDDQKKLYLAKMYSGQWTGTMLLTEPQAGSDLSALTTTARKNRDGTYLLTGNKIFISGGEHDLTENIIHPVLARIEGAPAGSRGISLFLVPKFHVGEDGGLGEQNDIVCAGIEEKMGLHGSPTCSMVLGENGSCLGTLLGEENKGLAEMFVMMNEERLMVGCQALSCASSSYLHAREFARTRIQSGRMGSRDPGPVAIINHPDVRRMLLTMKSQVEGMRSLLYYIALCEDKKNLALEDREKEKFQNLIDVLIPLGKAYVSDRAVQVCSLGVQVFGGYGYTSDYPVEQLLRDVRICPIYEGTNGIQAIDLMGRKLTMKDGRLFTDLLTEMRKTVEKASKLASIKGLSQSVETAVDALDELRLKIHGNLKGPRVLETMAKASPFLQVTGDVVLAWMLLWRAFIAAGNLQKGAVGQNAFYEGQVKSAEFFIESVLPVTHGRMTAILESGAAVLTILDESFGGN